MSDESPESPWIVETTQEAFQQDVIDRSGQVLVVVDFWSARCQPCRLLGPVLAKLADEFQGQFVLVKADIDQMPEIAAAFRVHSIPAVFALLDGKVVKLDLGAGKHRAGVQAPLLEGPAKVDPCPFVEDALRLRRLRSRWLTVCWLPDDTRARVRCLTAGPAPEETTGWCDVATGDGRCAA